MALPIVTASAISSFANSKEGKKTITQTANALKYLVLGLGIYFTGKLAYGKFKDIRAKNFANENIGHPDLIAATIIKQSFTRFGFPKSSILSFLVSEIDISTDEKSLFTIASKITSIKEVARAYKILFDRNLQEDLQKGLDNKEAQKFWRILNAKAVNTNKSLYGVGLDLYAAVKGKEIRVNKAVKDSSGKWKGTNQSYGNFKNGEFVGKIIENGVWQHKNGSKENYYIVKQSIYQAATDGVFTDDRRIGVVLQHQITDIK